MSGIAVRRAGKPPRRRREGGMPLDSRSIPLPYADRFEAEVVGRNVLDGRWTFQIVEEFDDLYYGPVRASVRALEEDHLGGVRHLFESEMKDDRRSAGRPHHEQRPPTAWSPAVETEGPRPPSPRG